MFDKDLITSPSGGELASSGRSLQGEREANALKAGCEAETSFNLDLMIDTSTVQRWELEQAERSSNVGQAVRVSYHGIIWAGAAFGASVVLIPTMFFLAISLLTLDVTSDGIFGALVAASIAAIFGLLLAIFGGGCSVVLVQILNLSLKGLLNRRAAIVISGGLAGFLPIGLFVVSSYQAPDLREADFTSSLIGLGLFLLFTFGAMLFGHFGALFAADSAGVWKNLKQELEYKQSRQVVAESFGGKSDDLSHVAHGPFQFRIQHLMIGMVLCSCVFALDQMFVNHSLLIALAIYIVLQAILLLGDWLYFKRYRNHLLGA